MSYTSSRFFFFFNDTATTEIYTLSLHDALPIYRTCDSRGQRAPREAVHHGELRGGADRKSTRLNSSHANISYAVFCLKKKRSVPEVALGQCRWWSDLSSSEVYT